MGFDPISYWKKINASVFIAYGEGDKNCPVDKCIERIGKENLTHFSLKIYPNGGHGILDAQTNKINTSFLEDLVNFIFHKNIDFK